MTAKQFPRGSFREPDKSCRLDRTGRFMRTEDNGTGGDKAFDTLLAVLGRGPPEAQGGEKLAFKSI
jgi:hypothetical protein